jgi:hypothetical protein
MLIIFFGYVFKKPAVPEGFAIGLGGRVISYFDSIVNAVSALNI